MLVWPDNMPHVTRLLLWSQKRLKSLCEILATGDTPQKVETPSPGGGDSAKHR